MIEVRVSTNAKSDQIIDCGDYLKVFVRALPVKNKANDRVIKLLADFFGVSKNSVVLVSGATSKRKFFRVIT